MIDEEDEFKFDFDLLDPTKICPKNGPGEAYRQNDPEPQPGQLFAETEQAAFHTGHVVPGIDFTNDPLLQGRLFSYTDTQLIRLGGPNSRNSDQPPVAAVHNNQRDGYIADDQPRAYQLIIKIPLETTTRAPLRSRRRIRPLRGKSGGTKIRARSESFNDHYSQAKLFWNSMSHVEKEHII